MSEEMFIGVPKDDLPSCECGKPLIWCMDTLVCTNLECPRGKLDEITIADLMWMKNQKEKQK